MESSQESKDETQPPRQPDDTSAAQPDRSRDSSSDAISSTTGTEDKPSFAPGFSRQLPPLSIADDAQRGRAPSSSSWSTSSDRQLGHGSSSSITDPSDRVFPIRSVVSVDQSQPTPWILPRNSNELDYFPRQDNTWNGRRRPSNPRIATDASGSTVRRVETSPNQSALPDGSEKGDGTRSRRRSTISRSLASPPPNADRLNATAQMSMFNDAASETSERTRGGRSGREGGSMHEGSVDAEVPADVLDAEDANDQLVTVRFRHVLTENGHAVITGREETLQRCEDEPIHAPGAVQPFGLLVVLREEADGHLGVRIASENSKEIIGYSPQELFRLANFTDIFSEEQTENLLDHIDFIRDEESDPATNGPDVFSISIRPPKKRSIKLWCAMHINASHPELIICEFELEDDQRHPLRPPDEMTPQEPEDTLYQNPTTQEFHESTEISSKPLRVLRSARKRRGEAGAMQVFDMMSQVQEQLATAPNLDKFLKILVGIVKELTGFHRVMVYQFDAAFNGKVVTEVVDPTHTRDLYHGLHFPASDIPKQARDLYKLNKVRLLYDRSLESARLVCRTVEDLDQPLDLSHSYLRAMSPIHLKYLANMAVRSSMSISINAFNELWGLIACHSYGPVGMRVPFPVRKMCRLVGDTASRNIERLSYASRLQARKLINTMPTDKNPSGYIIASSEDLLRLFDADFGMLSIRGETKVLGKIEQTQEALAMLEYLRLRSFTSVLTTQDILEDFPDLRYPPGFVVIAGLLYVPLSIGGNDFIVFFRKGQVREVKWAGNPYDKVVKEGTANYLEPRSSFKVWHETVVGKCREWTEEQVETAAVLCLVYGKFIEVWRQKEAALQNSRLTRLLLANSAHEVRTPLNAIINYLEIALEGSLDQETRDNLARSHSASKSLIYVINDLLDLTKTEEGQDLIKDEVLDLPACIKEATDPFKTDAKRKAIRYEVLEHPGLPRYVHGDSRRVRQAISNMTANAMQHTHEGEVRVEVYVTEVANSRVRVEFAVHDTGRGISNENLDTLFQDLEQVSDADFVDPTTEKETEKPRDGRILGLGLAVVARIVRNMDGQLRLKSEEGKGSRFVIQLPFEVPTGESLEKLGDEANMESGSCISAQASVTDKLPPAPAGEVMLVDSGTAFHPSAGDRNVSKKKSFDGSKSVSSMKSASSMKSGTSVSGRSNKSDADRLIDAIQTPLSLGDADEESALVQRRNSTNRFRAHQSNTSSSSLPGPDTLGTASTTDNSSTGQPPGLRRAFTGPIKSPDALVGLQPVQDSATPIKPVKVPDEYQEQPSAPQTGPSGILYEVNDKSGQDNTKHKAPPSQHPGKLRVLVAEDDPVNMKILTKRLERSGHKVMHSVNGDDCATLYKENPVDFDIVLMDMQMPIVDGLTSTKMIRSFENSDKCSELSPLAERHGRTPIFAVSASLVERDRSIYVDAGFDGWILKPIDFKRLNVLLEGISDEKVRDGCIYEPGEWERGGWFVHKASEPADTLQVGTDAYGSDDSTPTGHS
ncbi:hsp90-like protein [Xylariaceae sp. FL0016]|nr:hsp90-like protein [Xylariaceae sp. FL0016]